MSWELRDHFASRYKCRDLVAQHTSQNSDRWVAHVRVCYCREIWSTQYANEVMLAASLVKSGL